MGIVEPNSSMQLQGICAPTLAFAGHNEKRSALGWKEP
jgi:hypothetical protein